MEVNKTTQQGPGNKSRIGQLLQIRTLFKKTNELLRKVQELTPKTEKQPQKTFELAESARFTAPEDLQEHLCEENPSLAHRTEREFGESFVSSQGIKLTEVAKELSDEKWRLLYEDIFKPLDFYSILHERSKTPCSD